MIYRIWIWRFEVDEIAYHHALWSIRSEFLKIFPHNVGWNVEHTIKFRSHFNFSFWRVSHSPHNSRQAAVAQTFILIVTVFALDAWPSQFCEVMAMNMRMSYGKCHTLMCTHKSVCVSVFGFTLMDHGIWDCFCFGRANVRHRRRCRRHCCCCVACWLLSVVPDTKNKNQKLMRPVKWIFALKCGLRILRCAMWSQSNYDEEFNWYFGICVLGEIADEP